MKKYIVPLVIVLGICVYIFWPEPEIEHGPGVLAPDPPEQTSPGDAPMVTIGDYHLKPLAAFKVKARVLSTKSYSMGKEADISPVDLALGWGRMSDESVLNNLTITQSGRFFYWKTPQYPIPRKEIESSAANMHMIPADDTVKAAVKNAIRGNIVSFEGYLVLVTTKGGWKWKSSLSRSDTMKGACEVVYVEKFEILQ